jgi:hypothetical protein
MSSRRSPLIVVMQPAHFSDFMDQTNIRPLYRPRHRTIHVQRPVRAPVMIVAEVVGQEPSRMSLVQDDHVIQAFATDAPDEPLDVGVLPQKWAPLKLTGIGSLPLVAPRSPRKIIPQIASNKNCDRTVHG